MYISTVTTFFLFNVFFSHRFIFETCNQKQKTLLNTDAVRVVLHFCLFCPCEHLFLFVEFSRWHPCSLFLPGIPLQLPGLPLLSFCHKTCLILTMFRLSRQQRPLRSSFAPTLRRNQPFGSASLRRSWPWRASNHKAQVRQCSSQPAQASPSGHFRHGQCLQRIRLTF